MYDLFKTIYPRKTGSWVLAEKEWGKLMAEGVTGQEILEGLKASIANWIAEEIEPQWIPHARTYLSQKQFIGGLSIDITALSRKPYSDYTEAEWEYCIAMGTVTDGMKTFMPAHLRLKAI